jgi:phosphoglycolate phosphatase-like HAD superfamily hydrolase
MLRPSCFRQAVNHRVTFLVADSVADVAAAAAAAAHIAVGAHAATTTLLQLLTDCSLQ